MDERLDALLERTRTYSAFADHHDHLCTDADVDVVVAAAQAAIADGRCTAVTIFDDATGDRTEVEPTGGGLGVRERFLGMGDTEKRTGPGRPKLGVVSREVSLLPRHWEWLAAQPGGASATIRRLVDAGRKRNRAQDAARVARDAAHKAMTVLAGDQPGFEEAMRALYGSRFADARSELSPWPESLKAHVVRLLDVAEAAWVLAQEEGQAVEV